MRQLDWRKDKHGTMVADSNWHKPYTAFIQKRPKYDDYLLTIYIQGGKSRLQPMSTIDYLREWCQKDFNEFANGVADMLRDAGWKVEEPE